MSKITGPKVSAFPNGNGNPENRGVSKLEWVAARLAASSVYVSIRTAVKSAKLLLEECEKVSREE